MTKQIRLKDSVLKINCCDECPIQNNSDTGESCNLSASKPVGGRKITLIYVDCPLEEATD